MLVSEIIKCLKELTDGIDNRIVFAKMGQRNWVVFKCQEARVAIQQAIAALLEAD